MTLLYPNDGNVGTIDAPRTHAFVIGVGSYPAAKAGAGILPDLRNVPDLPSAADSAKFMCDWLLANRNLLAAELASLEVLISDPAGGTARYAWAPGMNIDPATEAKIKVAGKAWLGRLRPGDTAFFYCCGHGATYASQPVLFLEDLNLDEANPWSHLNIGSLAQSLRRLSNIRCAFMFSDACGEFVTKFELSSPLECRFFPAASPFSPTGNHVSLLCAASEARLAYVGQQQIDIEERQIDFEGPMSKTSNINLGRFTQTLVKGLQGASARWYQGQWTVDPLGLLQDLKNLKQLYFGGWQERVFEPYSAITPNDRYAILHLQTAELPLVIMTVPPNQISNYDLHVCTEGRVTTPTLQSRTRGPAEAWSTTVPAGRNPLYAIAVNGTASYCSAFMPSGPTFDHSVSVT